MSYVEGKQFSAEFEDCAGLSFLSYIEYPEAGSNSSVVKCYPRYLIDDMELRPVAPMTFPDVGCLPITVQRKSISISQMKRDYGELVVMTLNSTAVNSYYDYGLQQPHRYIGVFDPEYRGGDPVLDIEPLGATALSGGLVQVTGVREHDVDFASRRGITLHLHADSPFPQTRLVLVSQVSGGKERAFGPFEYERDGANGIRLSASADFDYRVGGVTEAGFSTELSIADGEGGTVARLVALDEFSQRFQGVGDKADWVGDDQIIDALGRVARNGGSGFSKKELRQLKSAIAAASDGQAKLVMDAGRRNRMRDLVDGVDVWDRLPEEVKSATFERLTDSQIADYLADDQHFDAFYKRSLESKQVQDSLSRERKRHQSRIDSLKKEVDRLERRKSELEGEVSDIEEDRDRKARETLEKYDAQISEKKSEIEDLDRRLDKMRDDESKIERSCVKMQGKVLDTFESMSHSSNVVEKVIENGIVRDIVAAVTEDSPGPASAATSAGKPPRGEIVMPGIGPDDARLEPCDIVSSVSSCICDAGGRDLTDNDIANLLICLSQGYALTLAGKPGTGKSSLAELLAVSLGLANPDAPRFAEVPVERGWSSYRDFIGYMNPLTGRFVKSSADAFDAFAELDREASAGVEGAPPYIVMLDEANLSPVEHYWAPFLRMCDTFSTRTGRLSLGADRPLLVPSWTRFVATVNFDHTTEELSPRYLDRSWVVTMGSRDIDPEVDAEADIGALAGRPAVSHDALVRCFGPQRDPDGLDAQEAKAREFLSKCSEHGLPVSPRSQVMLRNYLSRAVSVMDTASAESAFDPVDYAVSQKVLPLISGDRSARELIEALMGVGGLPRTRALLGRMIETGDRYGFYRFFC